ncbi:hypothetical protein PI125_g17948 [Phytophthora idaei]|nr:hypothetical protein PI125_g17948 [Phytophthora idaei]
MGRHRHQPNLSPEKKLVVLLFLNSRAVNGQLPRGVKAAASRDFSCHRQTITSIWSLRRMPQVLAVPVRRFPRALRYPDIAKRSRQCRYRCVKYSGASLLLLVCLVRHYSAIGKRGCFSAGLQPSNLG